MFVTRRDLGMVLITVAGAAAFSSAPLRSQQVDKVVKSPKIEGRYEFEIVESFDAQYLGDTPGHIGRHGELGDFRPEIALGDPIYRADSEDKIGKVSRVEWSRGHGSLEIEFDPEPKTRISVGEVVWVRLGDKP
jgi:hypothetical protein